MSWEQREQSRNEGKRINNTDSWFKSKSMNINDKFKRSVHVICLGRCVQGVWDHRVASLPQGAGKAGKAGKAEKLCLHQAQVRLVLIS